MGLQEFEYKFLTHIVSPHLSNVLLNTSGGQPSYLKQVPKEIQHEPHLERAYVLYFDGAFRWVL